MEAVLAVISGNNAVVSDLELYVVPGADSWDRGPGIAISAAFAVRAGVKYEIRMASARVPSEELELSVTMK